MLQWTAAGDGAALRAASSTTPMPSANGPTTAQSHIGKLDKALDEATAARLDGGRHEARLAHRLSVPEGGAMSEAHDAVCLWMGPWL